MDTDQPAKVDRYYDWLTVNRETYLIQFSLGDSALTPEQRKLTTEIVALDHKAKRCLSPPSSAWTDVNQQLINVISAGRNKDYEAARACLKDAESVFQRHNQTRNRLRYLLGFVLGVAGAIMAGVLITLCLSRLRPSFQIDVLATMFMFAGVGSIASVLSRLNTVDLKDETNLFDVTVSGAARPVIAICFSLAFYVLLKLGVLEINLGHSDQPEWSFYIAAFICGYSERLAADIIGHLHIGESDSEGR